MTSRDRLTTARLVGVVASSGLLVLLVVVVGLWTPHYDQLAYTVSRLGSPGEPHAVIARVGFVLYGLLVIAGAGPLAGYGGRLAPWFARLVAVYGAAGLVVGLAPKDLPGTPTTTTGSIHVAATVVGGAAILAAMVVVAWRAPCHRDRRTARMVAPVTAVSAVVFPLTWGTAIYGLVERVLIGSVTIWLTVLAVQLLATPRPTGVITAEHGRPIGLEE